MPTGTNGLCRLAGPEQEEAYESRNYAGGKDKRQYGLDRRGNAPVQHADRAEQGEGAEREQDLAGVDFVPGHGIHVAEAEHVSEHSPEDERKGGAVCPDYGKVNKAHEPR